MRILHIIYVCNMREQSGLAKLSPRLMTTGASDQPLRIVRSGRKVFELNPGDCCF
jgi:hypothetical protein